jgi:hypothetical protein
LGQPFAVLTLTIAMIETAFGTLLMAAVGGLTLLAAGLLPAWRTAVALPAITMTAQIENRATARQVANPLAKNGLAGIGHRSPEAELDNRRRSWQDGLTLNCWRSFIGAANKKPRLL